MKKIAIVAHSYGGTVTSHMLSSYPDDFKERVYAIAFTDALGSCSKTTQQYFHAVRKFSLI